MKTINVAALKASLSKCLHEAEAGERLLVLDRSRPIAEIVPPPPSSRDPFARLASLGKVRLGAQQWRSLKISPLKRRVPVQQLLSAVRDDR
jgi:antitoxin (DNA-binding transcriptional repressor) of toxin-antitoxin stability system